jgi:transposase-like protein
MEDLKSLTAAVRFFADPMNCVNTVAMMRWPDGKPVCPMCECAEFYWLAKQMRWKCRNGKCGKQYSVKVGTIFEESPIALDKWLVAVWLIANCKNGISSYEIARNVGVTQKSAWFMLHRIRKALANSSWMKLGGSEGGPVEVDEVFIGPDLRKMHAGKRRQRMTAMNGRNKTVVMGMLDRDARKVRAKMVPNVKRETLQNEILNQIEKKSTVYTDSAPAYDDLAVKDFIHETVNHVEEYVRGEIHTQGIENFWSLLKRGLRGTYVAVEPFHLDRYVGEQVFRYNNRATKDNPLTDADRFCLALSQIAGQRLTYAELTGKVGTTQAS